VVHQEDGRASAALGQAVGKPGLALGAERAAAFARHHRVERNEPNREVVDAVVLESDRRQIGMACAQDCRKVLAPVMVSGNHEHRHRQRREAVADDLVLLGKAAIGEVAGDDDAVGLRHERGDGGNCAPERRLGVDGVVGQVATRPDMRIGDVGEDHGGRERGRPRSAMAATSSARWSR
jgi:hypothetical protein